MLACLHIKTKMVKVIHVIAAKQLVLVLSLKQHRAWGTLLAWEIRELTAGPSQTRDLCCLSLYISLSPCFLSSLCCWFYVEKHKTLK